MKWIEASHISSSKILCPKFSGFYFGWVQRIDFGRYIIWMILFRKRKKYKMAESGENSPSLFIPESWPAMFDQVLISFIFSLSLSLPCLITFWYNFLHIFTFTAMFDQVLSKISLYFHFHFHCHVWSGFYQNFLHSFSFSFTAMFYQVLIKLLTYILSLSWECDLNPPFQTSAEDFGIGSTPTIEDLPALPLELQAYKDSAKVTEAFPLKTKLGVNCHILKQLKALGINALNIKI